MNELTQLSAANLGRLLTQGKASSEEITRAFLEQIEHNNDRVNCFITVEPEQALRQARIADQLIASDEPHHPIAGIPIALKDIFERIGNPVSAGSKPFTFESTVNASVVSELHHAGAVTMGVLNLDEFAAGGTGANQHFGRCNHPWSGDHISGGSSSGSAAAVSARMAAITLGSDAGGSIRLPAAYCGVTGLKPNYGRVSRYGAVPRTWSMDCIGPLAHSAADCAIAMGVISGWDQNNTTTYSLPGKHYPLGQVETEKFRVAIDRQLVETADAQTVNALGDVEDHLKQLGALIKEVSLLDLELLNDLQQVLVKCEGAAYHGSKIRQTPDQVSLETRSVIQEGFVISATRYLEAQCLRPELLERFVAQVFAEADVLLLPAASGEVPIFKPSNQCQADEIEANFTATARYTRFANYLGLPCVSFPVGLDRNGLPIGAQLLGKPWSETYLLKIVDAYQNLMGHENGFPFTPVDQ